MVILRNIMELEVQNTIDYLAGHPELLGTSEGACFCRHCRMDVAAIALNRLHPRYVVTSQGEAMARAERFQTQCDVDLLSAVVTAIHIVHDAPRHCLAHSCM